MKIYFAILLAVISNSVSFYINSANVSDPFCQQTLLFYDEIGCKPIGLSNNGITCTTNFECLDYQKLDKDKCYFEGKYLNVGESIEYDPVRDVCYECGIFEGVASFTRSCSAGCDDCSLTYINDCILQYRTLREDCPYNRICDRAEIAKLKKCDLDGKMYHLNEKMRQPNGYWCSECLCTENFDNSTSILENPDCERVRCWPQLRRLKYLKRGCVPAYLPRLCCDFRHFKCPHENDTIDPKSIVEEPKNGPYCKFGNLTLRHGEQLMSRNDDITCKCSIPPMITCSKTSS